MAAPVPADEQKQAVYSAARAVHRASFLQLAGEGAFRAPDHLQPGLQGELLIAPTLELDADRAEAG